MLQGNSFTRDLYNAADLYFEKKTRKATGEVYVKSLLLVSLFIITYIVFVRYCNQFSDLMLTGFLLGIFHVLIPVNISHDAIHQAFSGNRFLNGLALSAFNFTGSNAFMYKKKHLEAHASKENGSKTISIETQGLLLKKTSSSKSSNLHWAFYLFYAQYMIFIRDIVLFLNHNQPIPLIEYIKLFVYKFLYGIAFLVLPFILVPLPWWQITVALFFMYLIVTLALVVILLMPTEKMESSRLEAGNLNDEWAMEILAHNVDFSPGSHLLNVLVGGVNLNVVHYLFPDVNHVHYNSLAKVIERVASLHGLTYRKQSVKDVFRIHFNYLKNIQHSS